jgi:hypothetical protein
MIYEEATIYMDRRSLSHRQTDDRTDRPNRTGQIEFRAESIDVEIGTL